MPVWYHETYTEGIDRSARFPRDRYRLLRKRLNHLEGTGLIQILNSEPIDKATLLVAHDRDYVERFLSGSLESGEIRRIGLEPWTDAFVPRTMRIVGGAVEALTHVTRYGGIAGNMAGGTHHSHRSFGSGYCVFNDLAICALLARDKHGYERIAVLDLDVHQGDGTATILRDEKSMITISVHGEKNFPFKKAVSDYDFPLPNGTGDEGYLGAVKESLAIVEAFSPDILLFQAGVDALEFDALGNLEVSKNGMKIRNDLVFSFLDRRTPCIFFMGGGYSDPIKHTIDAFNDLFEAAAESNASYRNS
jgi:acetoin utilization deacetylase AcuC-like enzyme